MREQILSIIEKNSRIDMKELAVILGVEEIDVANELKKLEEEGVICGYHTMIDWEKTSIEKVTALIEVRITPQRGKGFGNLAERIYKYPEVNSVYLISGGYDLLVTLEGRSLKDVSSFVSDKLSTLEGVLSTATHFVQKIRGYQGEGDAMRNPLSDKVVDIKPSGIRKFFDIVSEMEDAISLGVGEPDFDTPWHIRDEGIYSLEKGRTFYTSNAGLVELRKEISQYIDRTQKIVYNPLREILVTVGGSEAIDLALRAMVNPGDEVLIPQPSFVSYEPCAILAGAVPVIIELKEENEFRLTAQELRSAITDKTKILILSFPNNPTGAVMERKDLEAIAEVIREKDIFVISDEIYSALSYKGKHVSIASLPGMQERTVLINGFSKAYAMTGWRLGYACAPSVIMEQMIKIHQFAIMCAPTTSQYAAVEALRRGDEDVALMCEAYNQRRRFLMHTFREMGLQCFEPYGAFYVFPCIKEFGMTSDAFAERLLKEEKVAVVPGTAFGDCGEGFLRISYAYSLENLKIAMNKIENFIERLRREKK